MVIGACDQGGLPEAVLGLYGEMQDAGRVSTDRGHTERPHPQKSDLKNV